MIRGFRRLNEKNEDTPSRIVDRLGSTSLRGSELKAGLLIGLGPIETRLGCASKNLLFVVRTLARFCFWEPIWEVGYLFQYNFVGLDPKVPS